MRVIKRSSLPQLREGNQDRDDVTDDIGLHPLPESAVLEFNTPRLVGLSTRITWRIIPMLVSN